MAKPTQALRTGMTILRGGNVPAYTLEYLSPARRKKAGEYETIVVPYIEIGRANNCNIQFGEDSPTVSRRHAAIERRESNFFLIQLSQTNPTLVNGQPIGKEIPLNNGDEIQLSMEGPKLRFNVTPTGTASMGYTQKIGMMTRQALRPYKNLVMTLLFLLIAVGAVGAFFIYKGIQQNKGLQVEIDKAESLRVQDSIKYAEILKRSQDVITQQTNDNFNLQNTVLGVTNELDRLKRTIDTTDNVVYTKKEAYKDLKDYIYFLEVVEISVRFPNGELRNVNSGWTGTAFLCEDGKLITARHCIQGWRFSGDEASTLINFAELNGGTVGVKFRARSSKDEIVFDYSDVVLDDSEDLVLTGETVINKKETQTYNLKFANSYTSDWAYYQTNKVSNIHYDKALSMSLEAGEDLMVLGFSLGKGGPEEGEVKPLFSESSVAQEGVSKDGIITVTNRNFESGNSGGPVFVFDPQTDTKVICIGIISFGNFDTRGGFSSIGGIVPIANIKENDKL
jgi:pSer/pThr/pTyr-binding forkhead associated (FHA) protein